MSKPTNPESFSESSNTPDSACFRDAWQITNSHLVFPERLKQSGNDEFTTLYAVGHPDILRRECLGLICSVQCPGSVIIKTFDAIRELRDAGITIAGGFHSPMERECLDFLIRGSQPTILCMSRHPKRSGLPRHWQSAIDKRQLLLLSTFGPRTVRTSRQTSFKTNQLVASLSSAILVPYASPGGMTEEIIRESVNQGRPFMTIGDEENGDIIRLGADRYTLSKARSFMHRHCE